MFDNGIHFFSLALLSRLGEILAVPMFQAVHLSGMVFRMVSGIFFVKFWEWFFGVVVGIVSGTVFWIARGEQNA